MAAASNSVLVYVKSCLVLFALFCSISLATRLLSLSFSFSYLYSSNSAMSFSVFALIRLISRSSIAFFCLRSIKRSLCSLSFLISAAYSICFYYSLIFLSFSSISLLNCLLFSVYYNRPCCLSWSSTNRSSCSFLNSSPIACLC